MCSVCWRLWRLSSVFRCGSFLVPRLRKLSRTGEFLGFYRCSTTLQNFHRNRFRYLVFKIPRLSSRLNRMTHPFNTPVRIAQVVGITAAAFIAGTHLLLILKPHELTSFQASKPLYHSCLSQAFSKLLPLF